MLSMFLVAALAAPAAQPAPPTNTKCPVMGEAIDPRKAPTVVVKTGAFHKTYYICCKGCAAKLQKNPEAYLLPDGTPKVGK